MRGGRVCRLVVGTGGLFVSVDLGAMGVLSMDWGSGEVTILISAQQYMSL